MRTFQLSVVAGTLALFLASAGSAQSLGDLARKQAEQRKDAKDVKVLTNKDVPSVPHSAPPAPAADATTSADPAADPDTPAADAAGRAPAGADATKAAAAADGKAAPAESQPTDEKSWKVRQQALQDALNRDQQLLDALQTRVNALTTDFVNRDDPAQRASIAADRQKALDEIGRLNTTIAADKKALADFEDEARRANVPPGWLR